MDVVLLFLLAALLHEPVSSSLFGSRFLAGGLGGSITHQCFYSTTPANKYERKYWCKVAANGICHTIVSNNFISSQYRGRVALGDVPQNGTFRVTMTGLRSSDSGTYRCGIGSTNEGLHVSLNLTVLPDAPVSKPTQLIRGELHGSVTVLCPSGDTQRDQKRFWCKVGRSSCTLLASSDGFVSRRYQGRIVISPQESSGAFRVLINDLKKEDSGLYLCGTRGLRGQDSPQEVVLQVATASTLPRRPKFLSGTVRGSVSFQCHHDPRGTYEKLYLCRWEAGSCPLLLDHQGFVLESHRGRIQMSSSAPGSSTVLLRQLREEDEGWYWCGARSGHTEVTAPLMLLVHKETRNNLCSSREPGTSSPVRPSAPNPAGHSTAWHGSTAGVGSVPRGTSMGSVPKDITMGTKDTSMGTVPKDITMGSVPKDTSMGSVPKDTSMSTKDTSMGTVPKDITMGSVPKGSTMGTVPKGSTMGTVIKDTSMGTKDTSMGSVPKNITMGSVPKGTSMGTVPKGTIMDTVPRGSTMDSVPKDTSMGTKDTLMGTKDTLMGSVPKFSTMGTVPRGSTMGSVPKDTSMSTKDTSMGTVPKDLTMGSVPKFSTMGTVPTFSTMLTVPKDTLTGTVPKDITMGSVPEFSTMGSVPKDITMGTVPTFSTTLTVPKATTMGTATPGTSATSPGETFQESSSGEPRLLPVVLPTLLLLICVTIIILTLAKIKLQKQTGEGRSSSGSLEPALSPAREEKPGEEQEFRTGSGKCRTISAILGNIRMISFYFPHGEKFLFQVPDGDLSQNLL